MRRAVPPSRCHRCGAASRDPLCPACLDYLVAYHPLWLDPALLPGPSLLDGLGPREVALISVDPGRTEWRTSRREPTDRDAIRLAGALGLAAGGPAPGPPPPPPRPGGRPPPHLAAESRLRAGILESPPIEARPEDAVEM